MARILIAYSTTDGHTLRICDRLRDSLSRRGTGSPWCRSRGGGRGAGSYDKIVVGASIRYGRHRPAVVAFIERNAEVLNRKAERLLLGQRRRAQAGKQPAGYQSLRAQALGRIAWRPREVGVFAGKIDYPRYGAMTG